MQNNPLSVIGQNIDIETGQPIVIEREILAKRRLRKLTEQSQSLLNELSGDKGELVKQMMALYIERINQMIAEDKECQTYEKLLTTIKYSINIGKRIVEDRARGLVDL
jgi:hypothetical protein